MYAQQTGEQFVWLLVVDHPDMTAPIRLVNDTQSITHQSNLYSPFPMQISLPGSIGAQGRLAEVVLDSVDETVRVELRSLTTSPTLDFKLVLRSTPDTIERGPFSYIYDDTTIDRFNITGKLKFSNVLQEAYPGRFFNQSTSPGVF